MKTLLECKYEAIKQLGFAYSWEYQANEATRPELIEVMDLAAKIYAKSCAEQALKDAAVRALCVTTNSAVDLTESILSTPILTP